MTISRPVQRPAGVVLAVLLAFAFLAVPPPPPAAAHKLTKAKATKKVRSVARQLARDDSVEAWEAGACVRRSRHAFRCTYFLRYVDGDICGQRLRIYYRNHDARRLSVKPVSIFDCNL